MRKNITLPILYDDAYLSFLEEKRHIPFPIKRIYFIYSCLPGLDRGHHAHKKNRQVIFALQGSFDLLLDDGKSKKIIHLDTPHVGAEILPLVWHEMRNISADAILMVIASMYYDEHDYIRDYGKFRSLVKKKV